MGCAGSKIEESEVVGLCRDRADLLLEAIRLRYDLADAHSAYIVSLQDVGEALQKFFDGDLRPRFHPSPVITLPAQRKGDPMPPLSPKPAINLPSTTAHRLSRSHSGSHHQFDPSDSDFSEDDDGPLHSLTSSPFYQKQTPITHVNLAKKVNAGPVTSYEMPPPPASPGYGYGYGYLPQSSGYGGSPYPYPYASPYSGFYGSSPPAATAASSSKQPPPPLPPPSPPQVSTWEFLNPFESYTSYYPSYAPSQNSSDLREEEGIPDLEEDETEIIKEAILDQKHVSPGSSSGHIEISSAKPADSPILMEKAEKSASRADEAVKEVAVEEVATRKLVQHSRAAAEAVQEIKEKFIVASQSCEAISVILEVGKRPSRQIRDGGRSAKTMGPVFPSIHLTLWTCAGNEDPGDNEAGNDIDDMKALSSTLHKLYIWENKLYDEVRVEEQMRLLHDRKVRLLIRLDEKGAESDRIGRTQAKVKKLATKIGVAIQVVNTISRQINVLRDEELWPQLHELIQGLAKMWRALVMCHKSQLEAVAESMSLDAAAAARGDMAKELEFTLLGWIGRFSSWYNAQKKFAMAMNSWLMRIIEKEPEETADGLAPFSPGRLGAPPVFVICNQWSQAMERNSNMETAVEAMKTLATSVLQFWDGRHKADLPVAAAGSKDQARLLRAREKEEREINRARERLDRELISVGNADGLRLFKESAPLSLHDGLRRVFDAMERISESSVRMYEDLLICSQTEQERYSGEY
ncbi:uncharacterized protein LOC144714793 [Wolffia australiana]